MTPTLPPSIRRLLPKAAAHVAQVTRGVAIAAVFITPAAAADVVNVTRRVLADPVLQGTDAAVVLLDLQTDEVLVDERGDASMGPASNMKVLTTAAALDLLGPDHSFATTLSLLPPPPSTHRVDHTQTPPSLLITGTGDPAFADAALLSRHGLNPDELLGQWVEAVAATGEPRFDALLVDDHVFDQVMINPGWPTDQLNRHYAAPVSGLSFNGNCLVVSYRPGAKRGAAPGVEVYPLFDAIGTTNRAKTGPNNAFWVTRDSDANHFTFRGEVNQAGAAIRVPLHDPPMLLGAYLRKMLRDRGITVTRLERFDAATLATPLDADRVPTGATPLHQVRTTLASVLDRTNQNSTNSFAEALFKTLGQRHAQAPGSFQNGAAAMRAFIQSRLAPEVPGTAVRAADGSGLSRENRVSARALAEALQLMHRHDDPAVAALFRSSLSEGGESGTLTRRFTDLDDAAVYGKSGFIKSVSTLSGYLVLPDRDGNGVDDTFAFAILFNGFSPRVGNPTLKRLQDRMVTGWAAELAR